MRAHAGKEAWAKKNGKDHQNHTAALHDDRDNTRIAQGALAGADVPVLDDRDARDDVPRLPQVHDRVLDEFAGKFQHEQHRDYRTDITEEDHARVLCEYRAREAACGEQENAGVAGGIMSSQVRLVHAIEIGAPREEIRKANEAALPAHSLEARAPLLSKSHP
eukprot:SRR837773.4658.p2 GENE.SRR837773.4658~~SRR837773.4658.p2  ORF type:complete len:188 (+),score=6.18 SRR837773.4658:77-565(+)